ncbi:NUDIX hydrolase [Streptomyces sp. NPDC007264]|uniref:NUDIX hydrolase n=1 Tax=Streptomyces sp. NPDC007264 TaxID=3364777 RepID=UPI0036DEA118
MTSNTEAAPGLVERVREILAYANPFVRLFDDEVRFPDGRRGRHVRIEPARPGLGSVVLPVCESAVGLVRTYRYALGADQWALPRGFSHGADAEETARAELREEIGATGGEFRLLGTMTPDSGLFSARVAVFLAILPERFARPEDMREVREVCWLPVQDVWSWVGAGRIEDGFTLSALALARAKQALPGSESRG